MGGSKKVTVGYKYCLGMHVILAHGPADRLVRLQFDRKDAWVGNATGGSIVVDALDLFGGESREGGVGGVVDFETGEATQPANAYLTAQLGTALPAHRGVIGLVLRGGAASPSPVGCITRQLGQALAQLRQFYFGMNPYLKRVSARVQRIFKTTTGAQWYPATAAIQALGTETVVLDDNRSGFFQVPVDSPGLIGWSGYLIPAMQGTLEEVAAAAVDARNAAYLEEFGPDAQQVYMDYAVYNVALGRVTAIGNDIGDHYPPGTGVAAVAAVLRCCPETYTASLEPDGKTVRCEATLGTTLDMNPAHIIRECLTDPEWGMGYPATDINDASFTAAADRLYTESMGISLLWDRSQPLEDFIAEIVRHIDAALYVDRTTGLFTLKLIRDDYDAGSLLVLDPSNIESLSDFARPTLDELINAVTVNYWDTQTNTEASLTVQNIALLQRQRATIGQTVHYPGFTNPTIAAHVAQRDLRALSTSLASCTIIANRQAAGLNIGDVFKLTWPPLGIAEMVMRVTAAAYGDGRNNRVRLTCTQDAFALPTTLLIPPVTPAWEDPSAAPIAITERIVYEVPYLEAVQQFGQSTLDSLLADNPDMGFVGAAAARPQTAAINARLETDAGAGYGEVGIVDFCPHATLAADIGQTDDTWAISDVEDLFAIEPGTWAQIDEEIVAVTSITNATLTVKRGALDTVPAAHVAGAKTFFWDAFPAADPTEYVTGESVRVRLRTATGSGLLPYYEAPVDTVTLVGRAARPYPPGNLKVNGGYFPAVIGGTSELALTWAHRDRTQQTGGALIGFTDGNVGPEAGTIYTVRIYGETDTLIRTVSGLAGTAYAYPLATELTDSNLTVAGGDPYFDQVVLGLHMDGANGSTTFTDVKGHTVAANGNAQISTAQSQYGGASGAFDGTGDYLTLAHDAAWQANTDFTVEAWIYPSDVSTQRTIASKRGASTVDEWTFFIAAGGTLSVAAWNTSGGTYFNVFGGSAIPVNQWTHVAFSISGTTVRLFRHGVLVASGSTTGTYKTNTSTLNIGRDASNTARDWVGYLDDLRITKGVARYAASNFTPASTSGTDPYAANLSLNLHMDGADGSTTFIDETGKVVTAYGNAQIDTAQSKYGGASGYFDGTGDYLTVPASADFDFGTGDFTIECWFRKAGTALGRLFSLQSSDTNKVWIGATNVAQAYIAGVTDPLSGIIIAGGSVATDTWHHIALTREAGLCHLWLDGVLRVSTAHPAAAGALVFTGTPAYIGAGDSVTDLHNGHIDDLRVTQGVARYTVNFTPPDHSFLHDIGLRPNGRLRVELESMRDGLTSYQKHNHTVVRPGYGFQYGNYYGGT